MGRLTISINAFCLCALFSSLLSNLASWTSGLVEEAWSRSSFSCFAFVRFRWRRSISSLFASIAALISEGSCGIFACGRGVSAAPSVLPRHHAPRQKDAASSMSGV